MPEIKPIQPRMCLQVLSADQLADIKSATLNVLENVGVRFPSERALQVFASHGAKVDSQTQVVKLPPRLVLDAMRHAPRSYTLASRSPETDLVLNGKRSYFSTDGCGTLTIDFETGEQRPSCKADVACMARVADYLDSVSYYWPMVSAQDFGRLAPLHELEASFTNTTKHVQSATITSPWLARYMLRMLEAIAGGSRQMRQKPPASVLVCTVSPLSQDKDCIEAAMVLSEAGIPVGFMSMPNLGSTAPVTAAGGLVLANAEVVSALVLIQLVAPGAPVFHSILASVMDPQTGGYLVSIPEKYLCNAAAVQIAHDWGVPALAGAFGLDYVDPFTWMLGRDAVYAALMTPLLGADMVVAFGLLRASTLLLPEQIILDDETYHVHDRIVAGIDTHAEQLALEAIAAVGPAGHFLAQKHTLTHMGQNWIPRLTHPRSRGDGQPLPDVRERARAEFKRISLEHQPPPLENIVHQELIAIINTASRELGL